jgi:hypothetical protein
VLEISAFVLKERLERHKFTPIIDTQGFDKKVELGLDPKKMIELPLVFPI